MIFSQAKKITVIPFLGSYHELRKVFVRRYVESSVDSELFRSRYDQCLIAGWVEN